MLYLLTKILQLT